MRSASSGQRAAVSVGRGRTGACEEAHRMRQFGSVMAKRTTTRSSMSVKMAYQPQSESCDKAGEEDGVSGRGMGVRGEARSGHIHTPLSAPPCPVAGDEEHPAARAHLVGRAQLVLVLEAVGALGALAKPALVHAVQVADLSCGEGDSESAAVEREGARAGRLTHGLWAARNNSSRPGAC